MIGICDSSPVRAKIKSKANPKPRKDLSYRRPLRFRIAGSLLTIGGSLFIVCWIMFQIAVSTISVASFKSLLQIVSSSGILSDLSPDQFDTLRFWLILLFAGIIDLVYFIATFTFTARAATTVTVLFFVNVLALSIALYQSFSGQARVLRYALDA